MKPANAKGACGLFSNAGRLRRLREDGVAEMEKPGAGPGVSVFDGDKP
jgi:hypothetical protein